MAKRREIELGDDGSTSSGISITVTRKGVEVSGWYDTFVGIEGKFLPWEQIEAAREEVWQKHATPSNP